MIEAPRVELTIDALAAGGDGVGREAGGRVVLVPRVAPGDRVRVRLVEEHARWARGEVAELVSPGAARVVPPCPLAATCGGCDWQHVDLEAQRAAKHALVTGPLRRLIAAGLEVRPLATPAPAWHWRRRARLQFRRRGDEVVIGLFAARSKRVIDVARCPQMEPRLEAALIAVRDCLGPALRGQGEIHLIVGDGGDAHLVVEIDAGGDCDLKAAADLVGQAGIAGVAVRCGDRRRDFGQARVALDGALSAAADDFAQATADGNLGLRAEVRDALGPPPGSTPGHLLELFAGAGNFTRDALAAGWQVTASDRAAPDPAAAAAARWIPGFAEEVVERLAAAGERFDAVLLDPPRTGARVACAGLGRLGAARVVYVSCDAATLGRDAELLMGQGYRPRWARGIDLMPQTSHVEVVCAMER
jgi:23S rRNA (uracil1939-C5)-methyltransferase